MAKKKVKKKGVEKKVVKRKVTRAKPKAVAKVSVDRKLKFSLRRFVFFAIIALLSFILYSVTEIGSLTEYVFQLASIIFGSISIAFLVVILVLFFLKKSRK